MAAPINVSSVGAGISIDNATGIGGSPPDFNTSRFSRTLQHYVTNNNTSSNPVYVSTGSFGTYAEGWCHINYTDLRTSMTPANIDTIMLGAAKYRVKSQGFTIQRLNAMQMQVNNNASTTTVSTSFVQAPVALLHVDSGNEIYEKTFRNSLALSPDAPPIGMDPVAYSNDATSSGNQPQPYMNPFPPLTGTALAGTGLLQEVKISNPSVVVGQDTPTGFTLMNGGNVQMLATGEQFSHTWHNTTKRWISPALSQSNAAPGAPTDLQINANIIRDTVRMMNNLASNIPEEETSFPTQHLIRVPPIANTLGNIIVHMELWITYHIEIEWVSGRYWYSRGTATTNIPLFPSIDLRPYQINKRAFIVQNGLIETRKGQEEPPNKRAALSL